MRKISDVKTKDSDLFVVSYPRSGNYWLRFMLATYLHGIQIHWNNFKDHCPMIYHVNNVQARSVRRPRIFGAHNTYDKVPNSIYLHRDPRDVVISQYYYNLKRGHIDCAFYEFFDNFVEGNINAFGCWRDNVRSWIDGADIVLSYDELQDNANAQIRRILSKFNYDIDGVRIEKSVHWCRFENMKRLEKKQGHLQAESEKDIDFIRKGKSRQWENFLTEEQKEIMMDKFGDIMEELGYEH